MNEELVLLMSTLKEKITEGVTQLKLKDIDSEGFTRILQNITLASNIVVGIESKVNEIAQAMEDNGKKEGNENVNN